MSAYCYTGSYQIPVRTLTDSIVKDIMMIQEIIGTGEIAISDHRSSQPTFEEFAHGDHPDTCVRAPGRFFDSESLP